MSGLYLEKRVAEDLAKACDDLISLFRSLSDDANYLGQVGGFGTLGSARALQVKFEEKAVGGPDALVDVLASHIAVVEAMQAQFQACIDNALEQESSNVSTLRSVDLPN